MVKNKLNDSKGQQDETTREKTKEKATETTDVNGNKVTKGKIHTNLFLLVCVIGISLAILTEIFNAQHRRNTRHNVTHKPFYWVYSAHSDVQNKNGLLKHVHLVLERVGFEKSANDTPWTLLWSHDYPFTVLYPNLHRLKPYQRVNHFPGTGYITNKVDLAVSNLKYIPKAFKLPKSKEDFLKYASTHKNAMFLEKHNQHRKIYIKNVTEIDLSSGESFVQEYVQKPFLVDGHKFDIGVYVVLTSVNPLRVYWYKGDVLFRYCMTKYYPFDPKNLDKYVVGDDYLPTWQVPSLAHPYTALGFGMKDVFDIYLKSKGKDPYKVWQEVENAIAEVFLAKEHHIIEALKHYPSSDNFFEMMRFDLMLDEDLKVYLLEANMSPNLSSAHYPPNQLLYEQVLYNLFKLTGIADYTRSYNYTSSSEAQGVQNMVSAHKNIAVYGTECSTVCKDTCEGAQVCGLCKPCLSQKLRNSLLKAHREHLHRGDFRRLFPPTMKPNSMDGSLMKNLTHTNQLQLLWYQGKCNEDPTWCT